MYVIAVMDCASFLPVYNTFISAALYIKKHNRWNKRCCSFFFFFFSSIFHSRLHFYLGMLQAQLLVSSYSTFSKKRRRESSVCGPFVVFAALAVTQRKDIEDIVNVAEIWWFLKLFFLSVPFFPFSFFSMSFLPWYLVILLRHCLLSPDYHSRVVSSIPSSPPC